MIDHEARVNQIRTLATADERLDAYRRLIEEETTELDELLGSHGDGVKRDGEQHEAV